MSDEEKNEFDWRWVFVPRRISSNRYETARVRERMRKKKKEIKKKREKRSPGVNEANDHEKRYFRDAKKNLLHLSHETLPR